MTSEQKSLILGAIGSAINNPPKNWVPHKDWPKPEDTAVLITYVEITGEEQHCGCFVIPAGVDLKVLWHNHKTVHPASGYEKRTKAFVDVLRSMQFKEIKLDYFGVDDHEPGIY